VRACDGGIALEGRRFWVGCREIIGAGASVGDSDSRLVVRFLVIGHGFGLAINLSTGNDN